MEPGADDLAAGVACCRAVFAYRRMNTDAFVYQFGPPKHWLCWDLYKAQIQEAAVAALREGSWPLSFAFRPIIFAANKLRGIIKSYRDPHMWTFFCRAESDSDLSSDYVKGVLATLVCALPPVAWDLISDTVTTWVDGLEPLFQDSARLVVLNRSRWIRGEAYILKMMLKLVQLQL